MKNLRLLILEDRVEDCELIIREIEHHDFKVDHKRVQTAEDMITLVDSETWDIIIADYSMPKFSALAALDLIKSRKLDIPFLVVSGTIREETAVEAMRAGANDYIMKNNLSRLVPAIERELKEAELRKIYRDSHEKYLTANGMVQLQSQRISSFQTINIAINSSLDLRVTLNVILDQTTRQLGVDAATILLYNAKTQNLEFSAGRGFRTNALQFTRLRLNEGNAGRAALERKIISIPDLNENKGDFKRSPLLGNEHFVAYFGVPLVAKGQVKGVLELFHRGSVNPNPEWMDFLDGLARQAAIAIDNATLYNELQHANFQLSLAYEATIEGWSKALDLRDKETEWHTQRVAEQTLQLAQAIGVKDEELLNIRRGSLLHDIGKMAIPDKILLKPGPLSPEEWNIMKKHPVYAYDLLYPIEYLRPAIDIPFSHHEKWDGTGYPQQLHGDRIPLSARIFSIIDVWDALQSDRPYRKAWEPDKARDYINSQRNIHFDPKIVDAFMDLSFTNLSNSVS